jgi:PTH1 family peptidyl-tRNA hydrolase
VVDWVLRKPRPDERKSIEQCIDRSLEALPLLIDGAMDRAMMKLHVKPAKAPAAPQPSKPEPAQS